MNARYSWHKLARDAVTAMYAPAMQSLDSENSDSTTIRTSRYRRITIPQWRIIAMAVVVIFLSAIVLFACKMYSISHKEVNAEEIKTDLSMHLPKAVFISDQHNIWAYDAKAKKSLLIMKENFDIGTFDVYKNDILYYTTNGTKTFHSSTQNYMNVSYSKKWNPHAVAVDYITDKFYVIDKIAGTLSVIEISNKHYYNVIVSDINRPNDLALDPNRALMFIAQHSQSIIRGSMDGTMLKTIIKDARCSAIALDRKEQKIYFGNDFHSIEVANYDGQYRQELVKASINIQSLAFFDNTLYWTWPEYWVNNATLWSCDIGANGDCVNQSLHTTPFAKPNVIKTYIDLDYKTKKADVCKDNADCQQICLLSANSSTGYKCACTLGWQLNPDGKTCIHITEFILYVQDEFIRGRTLDDKSSSLTDVIYPVQLQFDPLKHKRVLHFDCDQRQDYLYFSDDRSIYRKNIIQDGEQVRLFSTANSDIIKDLAFDWFSNNLYFTLSTTNSREEHEIMVMSLRNSSLVKTIKSFAYTNYPLDGCPYSLTASPIHGYLFFTRKDAESNVKRLNLNGDNKQLVFNLKESNEFKQLSIDLQEDVLYMLSYSSGDKAHVSVTTYDGSSVRELEVREGVSHASSLFSYKDSLIIGSTKFIGRYDKLSGARRARMVPTNDVVDFAKRTIHGMRVFSPHLQYPAGENRCAPDNGGCEQFCFAAPEKSCACADNRRSVGSKCTGS